MGDTPECSDDILAKELLEFRWPIRVRKMFLHHGLRTFRDLTECTVDRLLEKRNFGREALAAVRDMLSGFGLTLKGDRHVVLNYSVLNTLLGIDGVQRRSETIWLNFGKPVSRVAMAEQEAVVLMVGIARQLGLDPDAIAALQQACDQTTPETIS